MYRLGLGHTHDDQNVSNFRAPEPAVGYVRLFEALRLLKKHIRVVEETSVGLDKRICLLEGMYARMLRQGLHQFWDSKRMGVRDRTLK